MSLVDDIRCAGWRPPGQAERTSRVARDAGPRVGVCQYFRGAGASPAESGTPVLTVAGALAPASNRTDPKAAFTVHAGWSVISTSDRVCAR